MSGHRWVDIRHTETDARARINADGTDWHVRVGWEIDPDPSTAPFIDPTDPVATSTPEDDDETPVTEVADLEDDPDDPTTETGDATAATDIQKG